MSLGAALALLPSSTLLAALAVAIYSGILEPPRLLGLEAGSAPGERRLRQASAASMLAAVAAGLLSAPLLGPGVAAALMAASITVSMAVLQRLEARLAELASLVEPAVDSAWLPLEASKTVKVYAAAAGLLAVASAGCVAATSSLEASLAAAAAGSLQLYTSLAVLRGEAPPPLGAAGLLRLGAGAAAAAAVAAAGCV